MLKKVHWLGAGLSSGPGIRKIAESQYPLILWNRTVEKAFQAIAGGVNTSVEVRKFSVPDFQENLNEQDIVVSMLPAPMHPEIAEICLGKKAHLVTTSYISDQMRRFHEPAQENKLCFINESGLDPGIDHIFAHLLVNDYRKANVHTPETKLKFYSYCGGFPKNPDAFKYKFSWSPIGVLRALKTQSVHMQDGRETIYTRPWHALSMFQIGSEKFEVYPNRNSLPYIEEYRFHPSWKVDTFVRGTLRLEGWAQAWSTIFEALPRATESELENLSNELWQKHAYGADEKDRVVLAVRLEAWEGGVVKWSKTYRLDETGEGQNTAMARLVSLPATFAVESIVEGRASVGVSGAPHQIDEIQRWMKALKSEGVSIA